MKGIGAWVTAVTNNEEAIQALVLALSLKAVATTRNTMVILPGNKIHLNIRTQLELLFDIVMDTDEYFATQHPNEPLLIKCRIFSLTIWHKCVYIDPASMVIKNCDELFDEPKQIEEKNQNEKDDFSVFVFRPEASTFKKLQQIVMQHPDNIHGNNPFQVYLKMLPRKLIGIEERQVECLKIVQKNDCFTRFPNNVKILKLSFENPIIFNETGKIVPESTAVKTFLNLWTNIFYNSVLPLLPQQENYYKILEKYFPLNTNGLHRMKNDKLLLAKDSGMSQESLEDSIAIIGLGCKFPGANNPEEFWKVLINGDDVVSSFPDERWPLPEKWPEMNANYLKSPINEFDANFFSISPREAENIDPQQRILLEVAWEALENAGIDPLSLKGTPTGVYMGIWKQNYEHAIVKEMNFKEDFMRVYLGNSVAASSARISYQLGLTGPNIGTDSGCSSSMVSIHLACESLRRGDSNLALAGGINLIVRPYDAVETLIVAFDGRCKSFDEKANGFGRAEGCGIVILKKLTEAMKDGDRVMAIIRGSGIAQEGTSSNFGAPSDNCQALAIQDALKRAGVQPSDVTYVEAHGTGTVKGDPIEMSAIGKCFSGNRQQPLMVGSVKTNIGHTESAAGVAGIIKVVLAMQNKTIPPHRNFTSINPLIDLSKIPVVIPTVETKWTTPNNKPRIAGVNSFGISGTNVHIVLQEPLQTNSWIPKTVTDRPLHVLTLSAKTESALMEKLNGYSSFLKNNCDSTSITDFAFTANSGRAHFAHRIAITGASTEEIMKKIESNSFEKSNNVGNKQKIIFVFPGQGSQYVNMGRELYETSPIFRDCMDNCSKILEECLQVSLLDVIWGKVFKGQGIDDSLFSQTAIFCIQYSLVQLWESFGVKPDVTLGHSLGEFGAAVAAGILTFEEVIQLVYHRTFEISRLPPGRMLAVKTSVEQVNSLIEILLKNNEGSWIDVACINSKNQVVLSGRANILEQFASVCKQRGIKTHFLAAMHAYHSRDMESVIPDYYKVASKFNFKPPICQFISGNKGTVVKPGEMNAEYWMDHTRYSVDFVKAAQTADSLNCGIFIEIGPHPVLLPMCMDLAVSLEDKLYLPSIRRNETNWKTLLQSVSKFYVNGGNIDWNGFDSAYSRNKISLPTYPFERQKYWLDFKSSSSFATFNTKLLHPLVGRNVPLATSSVYAFQHLLELDNLPYLMDHKVVNKVLMPCTGMLEMVLASGQIVLQGVYNSLTDPVTPLMVKDLKIQAPLMMDIGKSISAQTLLSSFQEDDFRGFKVTVNAQMVDSSGNGKWRSHATGKFCPSAVTIANQDKKIDLEVIKKACPLIVSKEEWFKNYVSSGFTFGNIFMNITQVWKSPTEMLARVDIDETVFKELGEYLCHPLLTDAMIQVFVFGGKEVTQLKLPIGISKYTWFARGNSRQYHIYTKYVNNGDDPTDILLYDDSGVLLSKMEGIMIAETTKESFLRGLLADDQNPPGMYEEVWRSEAGVPAATLAKPCFPNLNSTLENIKDFIMSLENSKNLSNEFQIALDRLSYLYIVKLFLDLSIKPEPGSIIDSREILSLLNIQMSHHGLVQRYFEIMSEERVVDLHTRKFFKEGSLWKVLTEFPSLTEVTKEIEVIHKLLKEDANQYFCSDELNLLKVSGDNLVSILQGKIPSSSILHPEQKTQPSADKVYKESPSMKASYLAITNVIGSILANSVSGDGEIHLRVLKTGSGSNETSKYVLEALDAFGIPYTYTCTNTSNELMSKSKVELAQFSQNIEFKILSLESDPLMQNFIPNQFDIILSSNIIHRPKDLEKFVQYGRRLLATNGYFIVNEFFKPIRYMDIIFGHSEEYWDYNNDDLRPSHAIVSSKTWCDLFKSNSMSAAAIETTHRKGLIIGQVREDEIIATILKCHYDTTWIIISENESILHECTEHFSKQQRNVIQIKKAASDNLSAVLKENISSLMCAKENLEGVIYFGNHFNISESSNQINADDIFIVGQTLLSAEFNKFPKFALVTQGMVYEGDQDPRLPFESSYWGFIKTLKNENHSFPILCIDTDPDESSSTVIVEQVTSEIWGNDGTDYQIAIRNSKRCVKRIVALNAPPAKMNLPNSQRFSVVLPKSRAISDLRYTAAAKQDLQPHQIEVQIRSTSLNFRDIMVILKPDGYYTKADVIGTDFSGIISCVGHEVSKFKIGDSVFGLTFVGALASHIVVEEDSISHKPTSLTHHEASSLPCVFLTASYCLENVAHLKSGETVLIHAASGGVGICAIQISMHIGANVIVTAGSKRKRAYLRSLGLQHVFNSRNTEYGKQILNATNGKGVDVVLNSLTGPNFKETTLYTCGENARFIEIGKVNIWQNHEVLALRPDVMYRVIDLEQVNDTTIMDMTQKMIRLFQEGSYKSIPYTQFGATQLREGLTYLQKAKHIGKIVVTIPRVTDHEGNLNLTELLFNDESTYLITGGLGGIGLKVCNFLVEYGAQHVVLVGRSPPDVKVQSQINSMIEKGGNIVTAQCDIGFHSDCEKLLRDIKSNPNLPPLRGIMHAAGVLDDAIIQNQTVEKFHKVFHPKAQGAWNLHCVTKDYNLEHFVLFSSIAATLNPIGQSNYSAANSFLDGLAQYRNSLGMVATSINWGAWADVGLAIKTAIGNEGAFGVKPFSPSQGIAGLHTVMNGNRVLSSVMDINVEEFKMLFPHCSIYVQEISDSSIQKSKGPIKLICSESFWREIEILPEEKLSSFVKAQIEILVRQVLKINDTVSIDGSQKFSDMGMDSLMSVEMRNKVQLLLGSNIITLSATLLSDYTTVSQLGEYITDLILDIVKGKQMPKKSIL